MAPARRCPHGTTGGARDRHLRSAAGETGGPDGGLVIRLQADDPGPGSNWLPAPSGEPFYVVLRLYQPHADHLELRVDYPPIEPV